MPRSRIYSFHNYTQNKNQKKVPSSGNLSSLSLFLCLCWSACAIMTFSLSFTHPIFSRHVHSAALSLSSSPPPPPPGFFFLSPPTPTSLRFDFLYRVPQRSAAFSAAETAALLQDTASSAAVLAGAYALVFTFDTLTQKELIQQNLSRKLVHILSGLLFAVSWPIFSNSLLARYFASVVPLVNCVRLVIHGLSLADDQRLIKSVTREGNPKELLRGPLYYVLILILCALVFWRESPVGLISLAMMCGGDDILGRRFGSSKLPYNRNKSWVGSISMFVFGFFISVGMLYYYSVLGYFQLDWGWTMCRVALVSLVATVVESLPFTTVVDDNISVPLATMIAAYFSFRP
ncbi:Vitamin E pathway gene 5 isoform 2 [Theobroma cacao]|uniref:phytol kinase n=1 Tax=Theobroma cacao TaxID=3641 RepID=A0A061FNL9_THECC|nr:Vitamin E pathway gene 5 isoform 2 [Theobroma cacao]